MTAAAVTLALIIGCVFAFQAYWIWQLHGQVTRLQAQVCGYQAVAIGIADELAAAGFPALPAPPHPEPCP